MAAKKNIAKKAPTKNTTPAKAPKRRARMSAPDRRSKTVAPRGRQATPTKRSTSPTKAAAGAFKKLHKAETRAHEAFKRTMRALNRLAAIVEAKTAAIAERLYAKDVDILAAYLEQAIQERIEARPRTYVHEPKAKVRELTQHELRSRGHDFGVAGANINGS